MKKILILLFSLFLLSSPSVFADDILELEIEGISIGDSLLDYMTEEKILSEIERTKTWYPHLKEPYKYSSVFTRGKFLNYDYLGFYVKNNSANAYVSNKNEKYTIMGISGDREYIEDFDKCLEERDLIVQIFSNMLPDIEKIGGRNKKHDGDPSGNSIINQFSFYMKDGDLSVYCDNFDETFRMKNNYPEGLSVIIRTEELNDWLLDLK